MIEKKFSRFSKFQFNFSQRIKKSKFVKKQDYFQILSKIKYLPLFFMIEKKFSRFQLNFSQRIKESKFVKKQDYFQILSKIKYLPFFMIEKKFSKFGKFQFFSKN